MTISTTANRISYNGNGVTQAFSFPYRFFADADLVVVLVAADGTETVQTLTTDYSVTGEDTDSSGQVTMVTAPAVGEKLVIYRNLSATQETDYISGDRFPAESHERALDKLTILVQQNSDAIDRNLIYPATEPLTSSNEIPPIADRSSKVLGFDALGQPAMYDPASAVTSAENVTYLPAGTGAVATIVQSKLREFVSVKDFGAVGDGVADDTAAAQAAIDSLDAAGGTVVVPNGMRCLIDSNLTVKANVSLVGPHKVVGSPNNNTSAPYGSVGGALLVNSAATITLKGGASLSGLLIHRKGMTFPAANSSAFAGTAVTAGGDDAAVKDCMILGFNTAIQSSGYQRGRFYDLWLDNLSGINITNCYDIPRIENVHCWPFATIEQYAINLLPTQLQRSGTGFALTGVADWAKLTNCFAYGYYRGFDLNNVNTATLVSCTVDGTPPANVYAGSRGFSVRGTSYDAKLIGCQAASQEIGFYLGTGADIQNQIVDCIAWNGTNHGFFIDAGDWVFSGGAVRQYTNGVLVNNSASRVILNGLQFGSTLTQRINFAAATNTGNVHIGAFQAPSVSDGSTITNGTFTAVSIASASPLNLPVSGSDFNITGTTGIGNILTGWAGREINLYFSAALTVVNGTGSATAIRLSGGANFVTAAGSTLKLRHNGTQWYEIGRSA